MRITAEQLRQIMPRITQKDLDAYLAPLNAAMFMYEINTPARMRAFLAQLAHESGQLRYKEELASGEDYDTGKKAQSLGNTPEADGDGQKYKGRGPIQITGLNNYKAVSKALGYDFVKDPEALEKPGAGSFAAAWFWASRQLNTFADSETPESFKMITRRINGGLNGYEDRKKYWELAKMAIPSQNAES